MLLQKCTTITGRKWKIQRVLHRMKQSDADDLLSSSVNFGGFGFNPIPC